MDTTNFKQGKKPGKPVSEQKTVNAYKAQEILGISYPHVIHLLHKGEIKGKKKGKSWEVSLESLMKLKSDGSVTPRPRGDVKQGKKGSQLSSIESLVISIPRAKLELINMALSKGKDQQDLKAHLSAYVEEMCKKVEQHMSGVSL